MERYGKVLETPVGVAAGPHTQLSVNIIAAWLCGARYIELKTIQTLDELEVSKPCIDMQDEGYNCEWSQELKIKQSFSEYLNAWIVIHILRKELNFEGPFGTLFNMSIGYNMDGILQENVQWFFSKMHDCSEELKAAQESIRFLYPEIDSIQIPGCISDHITLSTMHGCPPDEIGKIGMYLIREKKLHTTIKLNPTLLGQDELRDLLNKQLGFNTEVPDIAFEHDLKYPDAVSIIEMLSRASVEQGLQFSVKLTNTLESKNIRKVFSDKESMNYMSGRALHPISIRVARKLQNHFRGTLDISFSAGVDCFNIHEVISCGLKPVTVCSDLLKPGGYGRLWQYMDVLKNEFKSGSSATIDDYICFRSGESNLDVNSAALLNLNRYADRVADNELYRNTSFTEKNIKTSRQLNYFDCIHAPCEDTCPTHQGIPQYMYETANGSLGAALETIFETNPFPSVTGMVCDHPCQLKCTRINYDEALHIREIKRYNAENGSAKSEMHPISAGKKAAIIGAGPAGLSCAWFLRKAGFEVNIFEKKQFSGGMVSAAIPSFRLTDEAIEKDIQRILQTGIALKDNYLVNQENFADIRKRHDVVFLGAGAQEAAKMNLEGISSKGVLDPLTFLFEVKENHSSFTGRNVIIIGGGNTAMDAARTAFRLVGEDGTVTIVYRRTVKEMPADKGEIEAVIAEGIQIIELTSPERINSSDGKVDSLECSLTVLAMKGNDGRPVPVKVPGSEFSIPCDTIIPAIGQKLAIDFMDGQLLETVPGSYKTRLDGVYIGGDALRGAATAINAIADGRLAAAEMITEILNESPSVKRNKKQLVIPELLKKKAIRDFGISPLETDISDRRNFNLVMSPFTYSEAVKEASRCLYCDEICNVCVSVCPNLANYSYSVEPVSYQLKKAVLLADGTIGFAEDKEFTISQSYQVLNIRDLCNECENCVTFCPSSGKPYKDKPALCLSIESLNQEGEGYFLSRLPGRDVLIYKHHESIRTLTLADNTYIYETDQVKAKISPADLSLVDVQFLAPCVKECQFTFAAEMSILMKGALSLTI